jgi:hypothetical protein
VIDSVRTLAAAAVGTLLALSAYAQTSRPADGSAEDLVAMAKEVEKDVAELRGWPFKRPVATDVRDEAQLRKFIEKRIFEEELGGGKLELSQAFLRLIGLIPRDCDMRKTMMDVLLNQIGGFYDPQTKAFYMLQRSGVSYGPLVNRILVAHELTHALDDQYLDLDKLIKSRETTEDWSLTVGSVVEGSATQLMTAYAQRAMGSGKYDVNQLNQVAKDEMERSQAFLSAPPYFRTLVASYLCGMFFVVRGDVAQIANIAPEAIQKNMLALAKDPPQSSEQIVHPEKYWDKAKHDGPVMFDDSVIEKLIAGNGKIVVHRNTVGEILCALLTTDVDAEFNMMLAANPQYWTNVAATGWGGDRFYLLAAGSDEKAAAKELREPRGVWLTAWDSGEDRDEFVEDYATHRSDAKRGMWKVGERLAVFTYGFADSETARLRSALTAESIVARKDEKPWPKSRP